MRIGSRDSFALVWLIVATFGLLVTSISHTAILDPKTVEVAYLFDEGKGTVAKDISENGRDGEISGAKYTKGVFGTCLDYDGKDDNLIVTGYAGVGGTDPRRPSSGLKPGIHESIRG